jgi:hypothetical protein
LIACCAVPVTFIEDFKYVAILIWLTLFTLGALMWNVLGIMIASMPFSLKGEILIFLIFEKKYFKKQLGDLLLKCFKSFSGIFRHL